MKLAFKVDVDTYLGTKNGVPALRRVFSRQGVGASFFFSLGEDQMGRSIFRIFQKGFLKKCSKSGVLSNYPLRSLLSGTLLPSSIISNKCVAEIKSIASEGFECGVHCWNHYRWQNFLSKMSAEDVAEDYKKAFTSLRDIIDEKIVSCASAGWQVSSDYLALEDESHLLYASDCRGESPFLPMFDGRIFKTPQIPTTLPTLDEILCDKNISDVADYYEAQILSSNVSVMTIHSELEGGAYRDWFENFLLRLKSKGIEFILLRDYAKTFAEGGVSLPVCEMSMSSFPNRGGVLAVQKV